jgi:DmsE family decaheme c-type cytochrome
MSALLAGLLLAFVSPSSANAVIESDVCLTCHDGLEATLKDSPHQPGAAVPEPGGSFACISCHGDGEAHADDPGLENMFNPAVDDQREAVQVCTRCHNPHQEEGDLVADHLAQAGVSCTFCHSVHQADMSGDLRSVCGRCHSAMINQFTGTSAHPVVGEELGCLDCHSVGARHLSYQEGGGSVDCARCHPDYSGPHRFEHEAAWSFSTEGAGCTACHAAHGSVNSRLLRQPDDRLCRQCHGIPPMHRVTHDGIGGRYDCIECHSEIHGSNNNSHLLDPQLGSKIGDGHNGCHCHGVYESGGGW